MEREIPLAAEAEVALGGAAEGFANRPVLLDALQRESLMFNLDASLRVYARHHFFEWTQGLLQNLVKHELLLCALRNGQPSSYYVDSFSTAPDEPRVFIDLFRRDTAMVPHIIKIWEGNHFEPVIFETDSGSAFAGSTFGRELKRIGANCVIAHGTYDALGKLESFFLFACQQEGIGPQHVHLVELIVPFLHSAWIRTQINRSLDNPGMKAAEVAVLTARQLEILKWIYLGKSNIEIGMILAISPLTVKNHVQKILRKLDVQNRTQAIGKGLALRLLGT
jgi:transcriptional regulator EpsA